MIWKSELEPWLVSEVGSRKEEEEEVENGVRKWGAGVLLTKSSLN